MELCFNVRTFFSTVYSFRSFLSLTSYTRKETVSRQFILSDAKKIAGSVPVALIKALECADKGYISQAAGHFIQMAVCFQSVDEVSLTKYDEDIIKQ